MLCTAQDNPGGQLLTWALASISKSQVRSYRAGLSIQKVAILKGGGPQVDS